MVELMAGVVVLGVAAAMAMPKMQIAFDRLQFRGSVRDVGSTLKLARSLAISKKEPYGVFFDVNARTASIFIDRVNPSGFDFVSGDSVVRTDTLPQQVGFVMTDCTNDVITFQPNGSSGFTGFGNIWTIGWTPQTVNLAWLNVLGATGRVHTETWYF